MRVVRTCDFCGDEAAGTFEAVPPEADPDGEGRRVVLCPGCRDTLASVVEPLLETVGNDRAAGRESGTTTVVAEPDRDPEGETGAEPSDEPDAESAVESGPSQGRSADGVSPAGGDGNGDLGGEGSRGATGGETNIGEAFDDEGSVESIEGIGSVEDAGGRRTSRGTPRGYRKVMRFLENRDFPMDREEAETLAAEAYGMDVESVSAAIDHAVKHDRLRDVSGELRQ